ncbi:hypothetical protein [Falsiphaeobacter marinintestinus]|uniref:hypothetical protein n=1 Tax=Falsiphaeobacter marinintestinus TaxID=1492905 RepID=UPI0011B4AFEA|nr:hypothetical protein [Phaeobacter marinintestinus]
MVAPLTFQREARTPGLQFALIAIYAVLTVLVYVYDAAFWVIALLILPTLPALFDLYTNPVSTLTLGATTLDWANGRRHGSLNLADIDHMRFDTRWDFSVRATAILSNKTKQRLPQPCMPPHLSLEQAFQDRGIRVERHHFRVF